MAKVATVLIQGQQVPWSVIQMVRRACGGDWDQTMDAFWKAREAVGVNGITKYVVRGLIPDSKGVRYSLTPSKERENGKMEMIRAWWRKIYTPKPKKDCISMRDALKALAAEL